VTVQNEHFVAEALGLVQDAEAEGIRLRILGSLAYRIHCPENLALFDAMERDLTDIDFAADRKQAKQVKRFITDRGYVEDQRMTASTEGRRYYFEHPDTGLGVDVFYDELYFCHKIPLRDRLELDSPTIPTCDLLLEKMQIVELNPKDVKDSLVLLLEHSLDASGKDAIDHTYVARLLGADWGFYYTVTTNLERLRGHLGDGELDAGQAQIVEERIEALERAIEEEPKTGKWRMRARIGPRKRWYQEVAEKSETF
jgi:hypothetical protein